MERRVDAVVIGAGAAGLTAAAGLARLGRRVVLVEGDRVGGECTNVGCIPSKRLIHLTRAAGAAGRDAEILRDVRATRDALRAREDREFSHTDGITLVRGDARLTAPGTVTVRTGGGTEVLHARDVVVATGSRPRTPEVPGLPAARILTNESLFEIDRAPGHLVVVGAGPVGVEMACAFRRLGSRVTLVEAAPRVLPAAPAEASAVLAGALTAQGVTVHTATTATSFDEDSRTLRLDGPAGPLTAGGVDAVLAAVGRAPRLDAVAGVVPAGGDGIPTDSWGRTGVRGVWAVGDVTPHSRQTHAANAHGRRLVRRIALPFTAVGRPPVIPSAVFSDPEVAWVGPSDEDLARRCDPRVLRHVRVDLADTDRGLTDGIRHGFVSLDVVRFTGRVVRATVVGPHASELIGLLTLVVSRRMSLLRLQGQVHAYPTLTGAIGRAADLFAAETLPALHREALAYARHRVRRPGRRCR